MLIDPQSERLDDEYPLQVVAMTAKRAKEFFGLASEPIDLGAPANPEKFLSGARVWGFRRGAK